MTAAPDSGVDRLFRNATDDLHPDVDRLVAGGRDRGRARRRRHLAGTAVAVAATVGVLGTGAVAVPRLASDEGDVPVATTETSATPTASPSPSSSASPAPSPTTSHLSQPSGPTVPAADIPRRVGGLVPGHQVSAPLSQTPYPLVDSTRERIVHFRVDGMLTSLIITRASASLAYDCADESVVECRTLPDGTVVQVVRPSTADQVTMRSVIAIGKIWMVDVLSYNAAEGKDVAPIRPEPALNEEELTAVATSDAWFE